MTNSMHNIYYCNENRIEARTAPNAAPDNMIIHLSSIRPQILKCAEKRQKHSSH